MQSPLRTLLLLAAVSSVAAIFYSDWADDKCPSVRPTNSAGCSWTGACGSTCVYKHRHVCREINPNGDHYCGDECSETCTALQGGGVAPDVCARDTKGYPGGCVNGNCVAEGSPASAHCYCYPGFTGVHCTTGSGTPPPPTTFCVTNEHTAAPLTQNCNNGVCKEGASSFTCACNTGWSGLYCLTDASGAQPAANTWQRNVLDRHNALRANIYGATHGVQPSAASLYQLVWDYNLEQHAQKYADSGKLFDCSALAHSTSPTRTNKAPFTAVGENLFAANVWGEFDPVSAVNSWFDEYVDYTLSTNTCGTGKVCGHYTQVVWANTRAIGCAVKKIMCGANKDVPWYQVICQYGEAGNYKGVSPYVAASDLQTTVTKTYPTPL